MLKDQKMVKTIVYSDTAVIKSILKLHANGKDIELDPTYSTGGFYKDGIKKPPLKFDIVPQAPGVIKANAINLPLNDESINVTIFDPPFLATTGPSLSKKDKSNRLNKRFTVFKDEESLFTFYDKALTELYRICKRKGILIFKCQDKVSSGKQYFSHCFIYQKAIEKGWYPKDLFILISKNRIVADWQLKNQKHARKFHSYYWVFEKRKNNYKFLK